MRRTFFAATGIVRRVVSVVVVCVSAYLAFQLYIFGGDAWLSALLVLVAMIATALAF